MTTHRIVIGGIATLVLLTIACELTRSHKPRAPKRMKLVEWKEPQKPQTPLVKLHKLHPKLGVLKATADKNNKAFNKCHSKTLNVTLRCSSVLGCLGSENGKLLSSSTRLTDARKRVVQSYISVICRKYAGSKGCPSRTVGYYLARKRWRSLINLYYHQEVEYWQEFLLLFKEYLRVCAPLAFQEALNYTKYYSALIKLRRKLGEKPDVLAEMYFEKHQNRLHMKREDEVEAKMLVVYKKLRTAEVYWRKASQAHAVATKLYKLSEAAKKARVLERKAWKKVSDLPFQKSRKVWNKAKKALRKADQALEAARLKAYARKVEFPDLRSSSSKSQRKKETPTVEVKYYP